MSPPRAIDDAAHRLLALSPRPYLFNIAVNGMGGAAAAGTSLLAPILLARLLPVSEFAIWAVCYPVVGYAAMLSATFNSIMVQGIAPAVARADPRAAAERVPQRDR